jgi:hypothetical protein
LEARRTCDGFSDGEDERQHQRQGLGPQQFLTASHIGQTHLLRTRLGVAIDLILVFGLGCESSKRHCRIGWAQQAVALRNAAF